MKNNRKIIGVTMMILSIICLVIIAFQDKRISDMTIELAQLEDIMRSHKKTTQSLIQSLTLNGYDTIHDKTNDSWYYSLIENHKNSDNPTVKFVPKKTGVQIAFFNPNITETTMENNISIKFIAYNKTEYRIYEIICTNLPIMSITYDEKEKIIKEKDTTMEMTLFDNRKNATNRVISSSGKIHVRGATTADYPKKGYKFSLFQESLGNNSRRNKVSLLGMRQDEEWILYAGYNDQEKVRNVFSMNLWMNSCAMNNSLGLVNGVEYRYIELFMNGEYFGLYALGYPLDSTQMQLNQNNLTGEKEEYLFKKNVWSPAKINDIENFEEMLQGYELRGDDPANKNAWEKLKTFYITLTTSKDIEEIYRLTDIQNSIDIYLFYNFVQGIDNIGDDGQNLKNTFLTIKTKNNQDIVLYTPWDLDITFGNTWLEAVENGTIPYGGTYRQNYIMQFNIIKYLHQLNDSNINQMILERYNNLRQNKWSDQEISHQIDEYEKSIYGSGAYRRDRKKWPNGSYMNPETKLIEFKKYVLKRLKYMDLYIKKLNNSS